MTGNVGNVGWERVSKLEGFKRLFLAFRREALRLGHARRSGGDTPFYRRELAKFQAEIEAPMDQAWRELPPTERQMFLVQDETASRDNFDINLHRARGFNHK